MYGILKSTTNTGADNELAAPFMSPLEISSNVPGFSGDTVSLKRRSNTSNTQRWELSVNMLPTNDSAEFFVNNVSNSFSNIISVRMPQLYIQGNFSDGKSNRTPVGATKGAISIITLVLRDSVAAGVSTLNVDGLGPYELFAGDFVNFEGDSKTYLITDAGASGNNFTIFPSLRQDHIAGDEMIFGDKVTMSAYYDNSNTFGIRYLDGILADPGEYTLIEAL
ncbi:MAG: hypothetical protein DRQ62_00045 [Gammaproteobacteria bacterium]|nr:MAG: hypothetical protein DRQ62_00045 [Gammaproteobacteria bacterium]